MSYLPKKFNNTIYCAQHPNANLIEDHRAGDMICPECGVIVGDRVIDVSSEWRTFSDTTEKTTLNRIGGPQNALLSGISGTNIDPTSNLSFFTNNGDPYSFKTKSILNSGDRYLTKAFQVISLMADRINIQRSIVNRANIIFKQVYDIKSDKGYSIEAKASSCLYIACRQEGAPRTFHEICAVSSSSKKKISRCYKMIINILNSNMEVLNTTDFMGRFCGNLGLDKTTQKCATHIAKRTIDLNIEPGRSTISITAAAIYMASQTSAKKCDLKEISGAAGVAPVTIKQSYQLMLPHAQKLFPEDYEFVTPIDKLP